MQQYLPKSTADGGRAGAIAPEGVTLPNGLQVLLVRDDSTPTVTVAGYVPAGHQWDPANRAGLAELAAASLWAGSGELSEGALTQALESRGINLEFHAHREGVDIAGQALTDQDQALVQFLGDLLQRPKFESAALERDRQRVLNTLQNRLDTPSYVARKRAQQLMYPAGHPFRTFATAETLQAITRQDLQKFHQKHYRPNGTVLAIIGDIDPGRLRQVIDDTFGQWKKSPAPQPRVASPQRPNKLQHIYRAIAAKSQAITVMGYPGITRTDPRYYPALVLNQILGGDTLASRLGRTLRDRHGLTYGVYSQFQAGQTAGPFSIDFQTYPQDVNAAIQLVRQELGTLRRSGVTAAEVVAAKQALVRSYPVTLADPDILAEHLVMEQVHGLTPGELGKFGDRINTVTVAQVNQVIQQLIEPDRLAIVTAGPPQAAKFR
ncbi:MAG: M16 family metallopeptidase [Cyanophyceae cyanobacterium]